MVGAIYIIGGKAVYKKSIIVLTGIIIIIFMAGCGSTNTPEEKSNDENRIEQFSNYPIFERIDRIYIGDGYDLENDIIIELNGEERSKLWQLMRIDEWVEVRGEDLPHSGSDAVFRISEGTTQGWFFKPYEEEQILIMPSYPNPNGEGKICYFATSDIISDIMAFTETLTPFAPPPDEVVAALTHEPEPSSYGYSTKELSRDGNYKTMEMYVSDDNTSRSRRITFELPVEWEGSSSVFIKMGEYNSELKVDMLDIIRADSEDALDEFIIRSGFNDGFVDEIFEENIYMTKHHEIFYVKYLTQYNQRTIIHSYFLYANGERFALTGYVFAEDKLEYDEIFKRIAESVKFQF